MSAWAWAAGRGACLPAREVGLEARPQVVDGRAARTEARQRAGGALEAELREYQQLVRPWGPWGDIAHPIAQPRKTVGLTSSVPSACSPLAPNQVMPGRPPRKPVGKVAASTPGSVDRASMKTMPIKKKLARLAVQQAGQNKVSKGMHLLSADTAYKRLGNGKLGGMSKKKQRQFATRAKNIAAAHAASAALDEDRMTD